jgi:hypothetical protein
VGIQANKKMAIFDANIALVDFRPNVFSKGIFHSLWAYTEPIEI